MGDKIKNFIHLRILNQIQQDSKDARDNMNKSVVTICNEGGIYGGFYVPFKNNAATHQTDLKLRFIPFLSTSNQYKKQATFCKLQ